jgi:hypothetical protein
VSDVLDVGDGVARLAVGEEQLEAYVARSTDTRIRVHSGELEHLVVADALGVGVRIVTGGREGFAYCGTLEPAGLAETAAEARENATYAEPHEGAGLAEANGPPKRTWSRRACRDAQGVPRRRALTRRPTSALPMELWLTAGDPSPGDIMRWASSGGCSRTRGRYSTSWMRPSKVRLSVISRATSGGSRRRGVLLPWRR